MSRFVLELLDATHDRKSFSSGLALVDDYLKQTARGHTEKGVSLTRVLVTADARVPKAILGYFTHTPCMVEGWRKQRALEGQRDGGGSLAYFHERQNARRRFAHGQGFRLNAAQQVHDATVFQPRLIVEETAKLLGKIGDGALGVIARLQPIIVHAPQTWVGFGGGDGGVFEDGIQQMREFLLAAIGHQEIPERAETAALIGIVDGILAAHDFIEQAGLASFPQSDAFAYRAI